MTKRTKIVCTIGPACSSLPVLREMIKAGMNVARFNFSHGTHASNAQLLETVRQAATQTKLPVALLLDLQGPKVRIGELPPEGTELQEGKSVTLIAGETKSNGDFIPIPYQQVGTTIENNDIILLDDGTKELKVTSHKGNHITAEVVLGGHLVSHKGLTIPRVSLVKESLTKKDDADLRFGLQHGIDFVALSFVRQAADVIKLKKRIAKYLPATMATPAVIVKIEKPEALDNFDDILAVADGVMIARGDLGLETPISHVPLHQKEIIHKCLAAGKPVITATEMLGSMQFNPRPTRAEVSDVANAVLDHTDAVMLSGETAMGRHPVRAVKMMSEVIAATETSSLFTAPPITHTEHSSPFAIAESVITLAHTLSAKAIVINTHSGYFARAFSRLRPPLPLFAISPAPATSQQLLLSWGVTPVVFDTEPSPKKILTTVHRLLQHQQQAQKGDLIIMISSHQPTQEADFQILLTTL